MVTLKYCIYIWVVTHCAVSVYTYTNSKFALDGVHEIIKMTERV